MAASSSRTTFDLDHNEVDDSYFAALIDHDEIFPISDEKYAEELQLQEALVSSSSSLLNIPSPKNEPVTKSFLYHRTQSRSHLWFHLKRASHQKAFVTLCNDTEDLDLKCFRNINVLVVICCMVLIAIRGHVASKIKNKYITTVTSPDPKCNRLVGTNACKTIVPQEVLERWESTLCESLIMESEKFSFTVRFRGFVRLSYMDVIVERTSRHQNVHNCKQIVLYCDIVEVTWHSWDGNLSRVSKLKEMKENPTDIMLWILLRIRNGEGVRAASFMSKD
ncbi:probable E3 ubiquitin-protein ligase ARI10 [Tanacetum coccineum]